MPPRNLDTTPETNTIGKNQGFEWKASSMVGQTKAEAEKDKRAEINRQNEVTLERFSEEVEWLRTRDFYEKVKRYIRDQEDKKVTDDGWTEFHHNERGVPMSYLLGEDGHIQVRLETQVATQFIFVDLAENDETYDIDCTLEIIEKENVTAKKGKSLLKVQWDVINEGDTTEVRPYFTSKVSPISKELVSANVSRMLKASKFMRRSVSEYVDYMDDKEKDPKETARRRMEEVLRGLKPESRSLVADIQEDLATTSVQDFVESIQYVLEPDLDGGIRSIAPANESTHSLVNVPGATVTYKRLEGRGAEPTVYKVTLETANPPGRFSMWADENDQYIHADYATVEQPGTNWFSRLKKPRATTVFVTDGPELHNIFLGLNDKRSDQRIAIVEAMDKTYSLLHEATH